MHRHHLRIVEKPSPHLMERQPRYRILLNDLDVGELYYNMTGYVGGLPTVQGTKLNIGEKGISAWKRAAGVLNSEAKKAIDLGAGDERKIGLTRPTSDNRSVFAMSFVRGEAARPHLLSRRELIRGMEIFGRSDIGIGFFGEDVIAARSADQPEILLKEGDEWMAAGIGALRSRVMSRAEAETHSRYIDEAFETADPEVRVVVSRGLLDDADAEPTYVSRQSLEFGKMVLGEHLRLGDLDEVEDAPVADPATRARLRADFAWLNIDGPDPEAQRIRQQEWTQQALTTAARMRSGTGDLDAAQRHEIEQQMLTGPEQ